MSLWVDRHAPTMFAGLDHNEKATFQLQQLTQSDEFPHLLLYGPSGVGKKTRISAVLRELYGPSAQKVKIDTMTFTTPSNKKVDLQILSSAHHIEITPSELGIYDRIAIQDLIKNLAQTKSIDPSARVKFKTVVLHEADSISRPAQAALRRTMEKYMSNMRVIMNCTVLSKVIPPIQSRCLMVRIGAPTIPEITNIIQKVASRENINLNVDLAQRIAKFADGNLRKAILVLEAMYVQQYPFVPNQEIPLTDWERFITNISAKILKDQSPNSLLEIRVQMYQLLANCIPPAVIIKYLLENLISNVDSEIIPAIVTAAADYEHRLQLGNKAIFHLEAFVAKIMSLYSQYLIDVAM